MNLFEARRRNGKKQPEKDVQSRENKSIPFSVPFLLQQ
jgi:hypothetical protein